MLSVESVKCDKPNDDGRRNVTITIGDTDEIIDYKNDNLYIIVENVLTFDVFGHDYNIFINNKTVTKEYFTEFVTNMLSQIENIWIVHDKGILKLISEDLSKLVLTSLLVNVMF